MSFFYPWENKNWSWTLYSNLMDAIFGVRIKRNWQDTMTEEEYKEFESKTERWYNV